MTTILENIKNSVEQGHYKVTEQLINQALKKHVPALRIVEDSMVPAMRRMGEKYKNDEADIPKILSCARCMRKGLDLLSPHLESEREGTIPPPLAPRNRHTGAGRMGGGPSSGRHQERGIFSGRKHPDTDSQFTAGNQPRHAVCLCDIHRRNEKIQ